MCGTMSAFIDIAAEESGDDDNLDHQPDEEPANVAGYDTSDGFVVVDEEHDLEVANRRTASRRADKAFEKHLDQAELEEETRQLALDHGLAIPKERKRLKKRKQASCSSTVDALDTVNLVMTVLFGLEAVLKMIAFGVWMELSFLA